MEKNSDRETVKNAQSDGEISWLDRIGIPVLYSGILIGLTLHG